MTSEEMDGTVPIGNFHLGTTVILHELNQTLYGTPTDSISNLALT